MNSKASFTSSKIIKFGFCVADTQGKATLQKFNFQPCHKITLAHEVKQLHVARECVITWPINRTIRARAAKINNAANALAINAVVRTCHPQRHARTCTFVLLELIEKEKGV